MDKMPSIKKQKGSIEVICGSMFSGKTEELLRRLRRAEYAGFKTILFKPEIDERYSANEVISHDQNKRESHSISKSNEILEIHNNEQVIGIDEAQFLDQGLAMICESLADAGYKIIVSGLEKDYLRNSFGPMPKLLVLAEHITKLHAICTECGELANYSFRKNKGGEQIALGAKEEYQALCRTCYNLARST